MKKLLTLLIITLLTCTACTNTSQNEAINMDEVLKISTWLMDEELEGTGSWGYISEAEKTYPRLDDGDGYWIPDDGVTEVANEDVFDFEALEVGIPRIMAPMTMHMHRDKGDSIHYSNLMLKIDYDGIVKVSKVEPKDSSIRIVSVAGNTRAQADGMELSGPCSLNICPVGKVVASLGLDYLVLPDTVVGKEYILEISGCTFDGNPVVTAQVKITSISDPEYPWQTVNEGHYDEVVSSGEERTRFCSIELLSYDYNELYALRGEAGGK